MFYVSNFQFKQNGPIFPLAWTHLVDDKERNREKKE